MNTMKSLRHIALVSAFVASALLQAMPSAAQPIEKRDAEADRLFREGVSAANAGKDDKAIALLKAAFMRDPQPDYAVNLGTTELNMKRYRDAADHLAMFLREVPVMDPADRKAVVEMLADAEAKLGVMTIRVDKPNVDVLVDGQKVGTSPLATPIHVDPGKRKVQAVSDDRVITQMVDVTEGSKPEVSLVFTQHIKEPEKPKAQPPPMAPSPRSTPWIPVGIGVGATLAAVSIGTGLGSFAVGESSYKHWLDDGCRRTDPACMAAFDDRQALSATLGNVAFWSLVGAGAVAAATIVCVFQCKKKESASKTAVLIHEGFQGVLLSGNF